LAEHDEDWHTAAVQVVPLHPAVHTHETALFKIEHEPPLLQDEVCNNERAH
jgi:hypothetical protein